MCGISYEMLKELNIAYAVSFAAGCGSSRKSEKLASGAISAISSLFVLRRLAGGNMRIRIVGRDNRLLHYWRGNLKYQYVTAPLSSVVDGAICTSTRRLAVEAVWSGLVALGQIFSFCCTKQVQGRSRNKWLDHSGIVNGQP